MVIQCSLDGGALYYNYKGFHSIILMALSDADCKCVDMGANGCSSDGANFAEAALRQALGEETVVGLPAAERLPNDDKQISYHFV